MKRECKAQLMVCGGNMVRRNLMKLVTNSMLHGEDVALVMLAKECLDLGVYAAVQVDSKEAIDAYIEMGIKPSQIRYGSEGSVMKMRMAIADWMLDEYMEVNDEEA